MSLKIRSIWDNEGETFDQYTVVLNYKEPLQNPMAKKGDTTWGSLLLSHNPNLPQGVSQFGICVEGDHLGKKIQMSDLSDEIQEHIKDRLK